VDTGIYDVFCAEFCGQRHSYMMSKVVVVPREEFEKWIEKDVAVSVPAGGAGTEISQEEIARQLRAVGERLSKIKGCNACHSSDGTRLVGPSYKGILGRTETVVTKSETRRVTIDEDYLRRSIVDPAADIVDGYQPVMPKLEITEEELRALVEYLKSL
jgi:cytochrome c oxidase subunit 2